MPTLARLVQNVSGVQGTRGEADEIAPELLRMVDEARASGCAWSQVEAFVRGVAKRGLRPAGDQPAR
jgi:hypothetical protein